MNYLAVPAIILLLAGCSETTSTTVNEQETTVDRGSNISLDEVKEKSREAWKTTSAFLNQEKSRLSAEMDVRMQELDEKIAALTRKADKATGKAKDDLNRRIDTLEVDKSRLTDMRDKANEAGQSAWAGIKSAWNKLEADIKTRTSKPDMNDQPSGREI